MEKKKNKILNHYCHYQYYFFTITIISSRIGERATISSVQWKCTILSII